MDELFDVVSNRGFLEPYSHIEIFQDPNSQYRFQGDIRTVRHSINLGARRDEAWRDSDVSCWSRCCSPPPGRTTDKEKPLCLSVSVGALTYWSATVAASPPRSVRNEADQALRSWKERKNGMATRTMMTTRMMTTPLSILVSTFSPYLAF